MQVYTEIVPPTGVTHAVKLSFLGPKSHNLIVAKTSLLQVFETRLTEIAKSAQSETRTGHTLMKFVLVGEYQVSGIITSLAAVKATNTKSGGHALLVSFKDAKISLVEWDPETHGLSTISIHFYENEDLQGSPWGPEIGKSSTYLVTDPSSRCAALKFGERQLALLPFRQAGDDLAVEDYDPDVDGVKPSVQMKGKNGATEARQTPYASSFVLPLTALDPNLLHLVDVAFLYEYREPTLGVLSSARYPSTYLNPERKDPLSYTVFTLDLEQRARTPLLSVPSLPYDLHKLVPLPLPVGGTLLVGSNEIIHIDQSGKTNAIAVNEFAKQCSSFPMVDQSELALKLEHCVVEQISRVTGEMLIILQTGELAILSFQVDGRSVSGLSLHRVADDHGGGLLSATASCAVSLGHGTIFVGSEFADSVIMGCRQKGLHLSRKRSHAEMLGREDDEDDEDEEDVGEDEDDLYSNETVLNHQLATTSAAAGSADDLTFTVHDVLICLSASGEPVLGRSRGHKINQGAQPKLLELVLPIGRRTCGGVAFLNREIQPDIIQNTDIENATDIWALKPSKELESDSTMPSANELVSTEAAQYDQYLITCEGREGKEISSIYTITTAGLNQRTGTDFEEDTATLNAGLLCHGNRIVQVSTGEIRCYGPDLGLAQIIPMSDEESDTDLKILHSSFADPYLLILRDDWSVAIFKAESNGDIEEIARDNALTRNKWVSGCLYKGPNVGSQTLAFMLNAEGALHVFTLPSLDEPAYIADNLKNLPFVLSTDPAPRRSALVDQLVEILVCDLGDHMASQLYLLVRSANNDVTLYEAFHYPKISTNQAFVENLRWRKIPISMTDQSFDRTPSFERQTLRYVEVGNYKTVMWPGDPAFCILKEAASLPRLIQIGSKCLYAINGVNSEICRHGLAVVDDKGLLQLCQIPSEVQYGQIGWAVQRLRLDETVEGIAYHSETGFYLAALNAKTQFSLPEDEWHQEWATEDLTLKPESNRGIVKLIHPSSRTVIHEFQFEEDETILCVKTLSLEVSEKTHERRVLIAVGTGMIRGEDYPSNGSIYVFDIIRVVPELDRPETNMAVKLIAREETRGAVTAISEIGDEGFLLLAQGQKCMVRGLKEDNTLLPIAFMDVQCYVTGLKSVKGTGMALVADALQGVWFAGFLTDPYAIKLFGKSATDMEVVLAEFLPWKKQLFMLVADADCYLHVLEFNPENPKSLSGQRLIHKSSFHAAHFPKSMTLLPSTSTNTVTTPDGDVDMSDDESSMSPPKVLVTMESGALVLVTQLEEHTYRRLGALQTYLTGVLDHPCGMNPRAYRSVESEGFGGRGILDGQILTRYNELGSQKKIEACGRVGAETDQLKADLDAIGGGGLQYL